MDRYKEYKKARKRAWAVILETSTKTLSVDLWKIAKHYNIKVYSYSDFPLMRFFDEEVKNGDGFSFELDNVKYIVINEKKATYQRRRFTFAHELGHCLLEHPLKTVMFRNTELDEHLPIHEYEANVFARDLLMPATVLAALNIHTPEQIMELCEISLKSAQIRAKRLEELYKRGMFNKHPLERQVRKQFDNYIINRLDTGNV